MKNTISKLSFIVILLGTFFNAQAQNTSGNDSLTVVPFDSTITTLIQNILVGEYVSAFNITSNRDLPSNSIGVFYNTIGGELELDYGLVMSTGNVSDIPFNSSEFANSLLGPGNNLVSDIDLDSLSEHPVHDEVIIEFDYIPFTNVINFSYIFASEEFPEYTTGIYNDVFGFFVSGPGISGPYYNEAENIALIPNTENPVTVVNIYQEGSGAYYIDNETDSSIIVFDGLTPAMVAFVEVIPFQTYHIKLAIGDVADQIIDSGVFLKDNSFSALPLIYAVNSTTVPNHCTASNEIAVEGDAIQVDIELPTVAQTPITYHYSLLGTAENGVDFETLSGTVQFNTGDLRSSIIINTIEDNVSEGIEDLMIVMDMLNDTIVVSFADNTTTKINTVKPNANFSFYPNPTKEKLNIHYTDFTESYELNIYDISGKLIQKETLNQSDVLVDISGLSSGTYSIVIGKVKERFVKL